MPRGMAWHLSCNPFTGLCHCPGQALGLCSESVPTGKPSAYSLRFKLFKTLVFINHKTPRNGKPLLNSNIGKSQMTRDRYTCFIIHKQSTRHAKNHWNWATHGPLLQKKRLWSERVASQLYNLSKKFCYNNIADLQYCCMAQDSLTCLTQKTITDKVSRLNTFKNYISDHDNALKPIYAITQMKKYNCSLPFTLNVSFPFKPQQLGPSHFLNASNLKNMYILLT